MMKTSFSFAVLFFAALPFLAADDGRTFTITSVSAAGVTVALENNDGLTLRLSPREIYGVYESVAEVEGQSLLLNLCGCVYLEKASPASLSFAFTWAEEANYVKAGYILAATGRVFAGEKERVVKMVGDDGPSPNDATSAGDETSASDPPAVRFMAFGGGFFDILLPTLQTSEIGYSAGVRSEALLILIDRLGFSLRIDSGINFSALNGDVGVELFFPLGFLPFFLVDIGVGVGFFSTSGLSPASNIHYLYTEGGVLFNLPFIADNLIVGINIYYYLLFVSASLPKVSCGLKIGYRFF